MPDSSNVPRDADSVPHGSSGTQEQAPGVSGSEPDPLGRTAPARASRYEIVSAEDETYVCCTDAPNLRLHVERGLSVPQGGRKRFPRQSIFLDGVYAAAPFLDHEARQYSLDHHAGCVRPFTLATCEQAAVMLLQGIPLDDGEWHVYLNEPDLDAVLAAWILLNRVELLVDDQRLLHDIMPLVRVEGVIDAHGLDMAVLTALPRERYEQERVRIERLRAPEQKHKAAGVWQAIDFREHTCDLLQQIDAMLLPEGYLDQLVHIRQIDWLPLRERKAAVLCHSTRGIYEIEAQLKQRFGKQLGVIVLDAGNGRYTLRQVDPFLPRNLRAAYDVLNKTDPQCGVACEHDNVWGGSEEIGGAPRKTGSGLGGPEILRLLARVYRDKPGWLQRLLRRS